MILGDKNMTREEKNKKKQKEIEHIEKKEKRGKIISICLKIFITITIFLLLLVLYARFIGTSGLIVKEQKIVSTKIPENFHGLKVLQFTDLHYGSTIFQKEVKHLVKEINRRTPDLVFFTGDLIDKDYPISQEERDWLTNELKMINATIGKYAVTGNHDYKDDNFALVMEQSGFTILDNTYDLIYYKDINPILLVGLSSSVKGKREIEKGFSYFEQEGNNPDIYTITLLHEPDSIDTILTKYKTDLALSGHSHNGQVRIPFYGSIVKIKGARKYSEEHYTIQNTELYVSSGIGTSTYPFRLFNHPSINFFRITKK